MRAGKVPILFMVPDTVFANFLGRNKEGEKEEDKERRRK